MIEYITMSGGELTTSKIAEILGLNYDETNGIAYMGEVETVGISFGNQFQDLFIYSKINSDTSSRIFTHTQTDGTYNHTMCYKKSDNGVIFGFSNNTSRVLNMACIKINYLDTSESGVAYVYSTTSGSITIYTDRGNMFTITDTMIVTGDLVCLYPIISPTLLLTSDTAFVTKYFDQLANCVEFVLNEQNYVTLTPPEDTSIRLALRV